MNPLPLLARELTVASRRPMTQRLKLGFGGGSMVVVVWALLVSTGAAGPKVFVVLATGAAIMALFTAIFVASDTLSRERREGTLGFLFLTDLNAGDIVAGKLAAAGLVPMVTLLSMFPAFALCQLVGGIPAGLFWRMNIALVIALLFSLSAAIYVSSLCEDHRKAYTGATILLLTVSPLWLCASALWTGWGTFVWVAFLFSLLSASFFWFSAKRLGAAWRDVPKEPQVEGEAARKRRAGGGLLEKFPVAWMMLRRQPASSVWRKMGLLMIAALLLGGLPLARTGAGATQVLWGLLALHLGYQFVLIARTAYSFYGDKQNGSLELLLGSELKNEEIFDGFNRYLIRKSTPFIAFLTVVDASYAVMIKLSGGGKLAALPVGLAAGLWITLLGLGWLGVYRSLMMKHPSLAMLATFARLSLVPMLLGLMFLNVPRTDPEKVAMFYAFSSLMLEFFFASDAKSALTEHGRTLLLRPYSEKPPHIENPWSFIDWDEANQSEKEGFSDRVEYPVSGQGFSQSSC
jgi:hypothetical protein